MRLRSHWKTLITTAALVLGASAASPQPPQREELAHRLIMTRHHWWSAAPIRQYNGLWDFDPQTGALRRLRPLSLTLSGGNVPDLGYQTGWGHLLASIDNKVVVQMWPFFLEIEVPSWRLLRRYPPSADLEPVGWAVQGPMLSEQEGVTVGLEPGIYGFASCLLYKLRGGPCETHQFPGWEAPRDWDGDTSVLLHRSLDPRLDEISFSSRLTPYDYHFENLPSLSFDRDGGGFWRVGPRTIEFLPITNGVVGPASIVHEPMFPPLDNEDWQLSTLYLHPRFHTLFGVATNTRGAGSLFFVLDRNLSLSGTYDIPSDTYVGWPISLTSLGDAPTSYQQTIPVVSSTAGRHDTTWSTDLWFFNPSDEPTTVTVRRVTTPEDERTVELPGHGSERISDALDWIGGGPDGDGVPNDALVITSPARWGEELVAVSRTFNTNDAGGTFGQAVPAVPGTLGYTNHLPYDPYKGGRDLYYPPAPGLRVSNLSLDRRTPDRYRHNLGIANDGNEPVQLTLVWGWLDPRYDDLPLYEFRTPENVRHITVVPHALRIVNLERLFPASVREGWPPRVAVYGDRPAVLWLSMVDNITGDATFVPYTNYHYRTDSDDDRSALPVVAHNPGEGGTQWKTDLYGFQGDSRYDEPLAFFHPQRRAEQCSGVAGVGEISAHLQGNIGMPLDDWMDTINALGLSWAPDWLVQDDLRIVFPDVVRLFAECEGEQDIKGGLEISTASWTSGYSRTYTTRDDGGTYGGMLPLYPPNGWPVQHFAGIEVGSGFRINVGLFNGDHNHTITHRLTLYGADGTEVASADFDLAPLELRQQSLAHILGLPAGSLEEGTYGLTVVPLDDEESGVQGRSWAFVSLVDNTTGDPTNWW